MRNMKYLSIVFTFVLSVFFIIAKGQSAQGQGAPANTTAGKSNLPTPRVQAYTPKPRVKPVPHDLHITQPKAVPVKPAPQPINK